MDFAEMLNTQYMTTQTKSNLDTLIANYRHWNTMVNLFTNFANKPICGKPLRGFKAAKRNAKIAQTAQDNLNNATNALRNYVRDTKLSKERRTKRLQAIQAAIPSFTLE